MPLTPEEIEEASRRFREELEDQHAQRVQTIEHRRQRAREKRKDSETRDRQLELTKVQEKVREQFYKDKGYQLYVDSTGREAWLAPEEFEWRTRRRRHRRKRRVFEPAFAPRGRVILFYVGLFVLAVIVGILLAR